MNRPVTCPCSFSCAVGAVLALAAWHAGAAALGPSDAVAAGQGSGDLETVTVYARRLVPVSRVAATVSVITQETIERTLVADVEQLVRYEPGLSVRSDPFRFGADTIAIRGIGGNRVAVEVDGVPSAGGFALGNFADSGRAFVDPAFLRRVEVLRGPASSLYGSDALGGVVSMSTITPQSLLAAGRDDGWSVSSGYSGVDSGWHGAVLGGARSVDTAALLGYVHRQGTEPGTVADVEPNPRDYRSDSLLAKVEFGAIPGGPLALAVELTRVQQETSVNAWLGLVGTRFANTTALEGDDLQQRHRMSVGQRVPANRVFDSADWKLYLQATDTNQDTREERKAVPPRAPPLAIDREFRLEDRTVGLEFTAVRAIDGSRVSHTLVYGVEAADSRIEERRDGRQTNLDTGAVTNVILGESFPLRDFPITDVTRFGAFVQDELQADGSGWALIPALRLDYYRLGPRVDQMYRDDNPNSAAAGLDDSAITPKLGVTRGLGNGLVAFAQYARGFRAPPPEDLNIGLELPLLNIRAIPNPELRPETSEGYELGLRWSGAPGGFTASVFLTEYSDFIESKVNLGVDPATGVTLFQSQNVAEARIYGVEFDVRADASAWSRRMTGWTGRLAASWTRGEDLVRDQPLNSIDPPQLLLSVRYDARTARWGSELAVTAVEAQREVDRSRADLYRTDGYATLDWLANVSLGARLRLNLGLFNLTDAEYIEWADIRGRLAGDPLIPYYTRAGFNASVSLRYDF